ncbi:phospholipid scramblase 1-like [Pygocentrus nattereri]|uniref:phospholipid scramblase 1-like n=1 Tax=Pygocentrus nattereri TaxID=42514 RepID=UPI0008147D0B|nr:phospholipid scramblase 1-like [Pygocentrus nattereri]
MAASAQTPQRLIDCPTGLESLAQVERLLVHQQIDLLEVVSGMSTNNNYIVKDAAGQQMFFAAEENDSCNRMCCGSSRSFTISLTDNSRREVFTLERSLNCSSCCCPCCLQELEVHAPRGKPIGYVTQNWHPCLPKFTILNERRKPVLKIDGQCCMGSCGSQVYFKIKTLDTSSLVGAIFKQPTDIVQERFTNADNYGLQFPVDLDVKIKATVLGACFLIDFMYFEGKPTAPATRVC